MTDTTTTKAALVVAAVGVIATSTMGILTIATVITSDKDGEIEVMTVIEDMATGETTIIHRQEDSRTKTRILPAIAENAATIATEVSAMTPAQITICPRLLLFQ